MINAEFMANRRFLSATNFFRLSLRREQIEPDLSLPIYNSYGNLPDAFLEEKKKVYETVQEMEEVLEALHEMLKCTKPSEAFKLYDKVVSQFVSRRNLTFSADFFYDTSFLYGIEEHDARLKYLRDVGLVAPYTVLVSEFENAVYRRILEIGKIDGYARVQVQFVPDSLRCLSVDVTESAVANDPPAEASPGKILLYINLESLLGQRQPKGYESNIAILLKSRAAWFVSHFQVQLDSLVFRQAPFIQP